jgi:hypothetical protein
MDPKPKVDPYPAPVALTALDLKRVQRMQIEKGRDARLRRLARRNRDVAWLIEQQERAAKPKVVKPSKP